MRVPLQTAALWAEDGQEWFPRRSLGSSPGYIGRRSFAAQFASDVFGIDFGNQSGGAADGGGGSTWFPSQGSKPPPPQPPLRPIVKILANLPPPRERLVDQDGFVTRSWWRYFQLIGSKADGT